VGFVVQPGAEHGVPGRRRRQIGNLAHIEPRHIDVGDRVRPGECVAESVDLICDIPHHLALENPDTLLVYRLNPT
jgi:hypothetical protein